MAKLTTKQIQKNNRRALDAVFGAKTPEGFSRKEERNAPDGYGGKHTQLVLESPDIKIRVTVDLDQTWTPHYLGSGHVDFNTTHGWRTFDLRGVSDSFYVDNDCTSDGLDVEIAEQIKKARDRAKEANSSLPVPGFPFSCILSAERVEQIKKELKAGKHPRLAPGGMGTGYTLTTHRPRDRYGWSPAKPETCKFFDAPQLYLVSFDHD